MNLSPPGPCTRGLLLFATLCMTLAGCSERSLDEDASEGVSQACKNYCEYFDECHSQDYSECTSSCEEERDEYTNANCASAFDNFLDCVGTLHCEEWEGTCDTLLIAAQACMA